MQAVGGEVGSVKEDDRPGPSGICLRKIREQAEREFLKQQVCGFWETYRETERQNVVSLNKAFKEYGKSDTIIDFKDFAQITKSYAKEIGLWMKCKGTICLREEDAKQGEADSVEAQPKGKLKWRGKKKRVDPNIRSFINEHYEDSEDSGEVVSLCSLCHHIP